MKVIVSFSGGKDSLASLLWVRNNLTKDFITVFCDTGWEHPLTYKYIEEVQEQLGLNLITVKSKKFNGMVDLTKKKSRWPSSQRRFCTSELKTIPMIDYILDEVIYNISVQEPERISYIAGLEQQFNSSFFGPDKISSKYYKGEYPLISDVVRYVQSKRAGGSLFDDDVATSCMSYYGLCE